MGRLTQMIEYLNRVKHPSKDDLASKFTHINVTEHTKSIRFVYRKQHFKKQEK